VRVVYRLLGELEISWDDQSLNLPGGHRLIVLAALLINANQRISKAELLQAAWGSEEVSEAQLHKAAAALRALLGQIGRDGDLVTHTRYGYEIQVSDDNLDMLLFRRLVLQADEARSHRRADDEISHLGLALGLWRGQRPLSNVPSDAFRHEIDRLEQRRKRAAVRLFDLEITRRGYDRILDGLALIAGYYPDDGRLGEQLMIAAYRCGHVTDATAAYERHAAALGEQTGGAPDPALRALYYAIASGDEPAVAAAESAIARRAGLPASAGLGAGAATPRQLPPDPADLVGRDDLVAEASWLLGRPPSRAIPVVVISGPGGIGKTALARRVAHLLNERYPDGQLYTELRGTAGQPADPSEVLAQFLRAFGAPTVPETLPERIATYRTLVANRRVLVVLDDAAGGAQIRDLIPASPACGVLVTARQRLPEIDGAHHLPPLAPLSRAASTELFLRVVGNSGIDLQAERDAVGRVVALCGGLPLALRIAGALRVHDHPRPTAELADRLARQGPEAFTYGELSVARTIGAGFDRLGDDARGLFLKLGLLHLSSFGLWTAAALRSATDTDAAAVLSQLAARYMVELAESELRYRFHDLTREYAARRARSKYPSEDDHIAVLTQAYRALLTLTRRAHVCLYGGDFEVVHSAVPDWDAPQAAAAEVDEAPLDWFEKERLNIRAAVSHCADLGLTNICWDLAVSSHEFYTLRGYFDDWYATHTAALRACRGAGDLRGEGVVLACLGQPALVASRRTGVSGLAELQRSADLLAQCHERHGQAIALRTLANALRRRGHLARPLALFNEALAHYEASGDTVGWWLTLRYIGKTHLDRGRHDEALRVLQAAERAAGEFGEQRLLAQTRYWIGQTCLAVGDLAGAAAAFNAVLDVYSEPTSTGHAYAVHGLGDLALRTGEFRDAERYLGLAADLARDGADAVLEGRAYLSAAELHAALGRPEKWLAALEQAVSCFAGCSAAYLQAEALAALARAHEDLGDGATARAAWARVEDLYKEMGLPEEDRIHRAPPGPAA
jgi:DNA-binding SARP family transcriptional activator/tetratricopeptide (TPR) repeat protein